VTFENSVAVFFVAEGRELGMSSKTIKTGTLFRTFPLDRGDSGLRIDEKKRTVELSFSSEEPIERYFGVEILDHGPGSVRLDRLNKGGPLLVDHDPKDPVGVVERVSVGRDRKGRAVVRFGQSDRAKDVFRDVSDGIRRNVSVGYQIHRMVPEGENEGVKTYRAVDWEPMEISLVSVPADTTVGVGRAHQLNTTIEISERSSVMEESGKYKQSKDNGVHSERNRVREILAYGKQFGCADEAQRAIEDGMSVDAFRKIVMERIRANGPVPMVQSGTEELGFGRNDRKKYSLLKAIRLLVDQKFARDYDGIELEASRELERRLGRETRGILVPLRDIGPDFIKRDITVGGTGQYLVGTDVLAGDFIDVLRNRSFVMQAGARLLSQLVGDVSIPKKSASATAYWLNADGTSSITESTPTFGAVQMTPKTVAGLVDISHKQLIQSSPDVENLVRDDLADTIAVAVDLAALAGTGADNQPTGILNTSGIGSNTYANGGSPDYADILTLESDVAAANADVSGCAYFTTPAMRATLKQVFSNATYGEIPCWTSGKEPGTGMMNGYRAFATSQMPSGYVLFGDFSQLLVGEWGILQLAADPYGTNFAKGTVSVRAMYDVDMGVRHAGAFSELHEAA